MRHEDPQIHSAHTLDKEFHTTTTMSVTVTAMQLYLVLIKKSVCCTAASPNPCGVGRGCGVHTAWVGGYIHAHPVAHQHGRATGGRPGDEGLGF